VRPQSEMNGSAGNTISTGESSEGVSLLDSADESRKAIKELGNSKRTMSGAMRAAGISESKTRRREKALNAKLEKHLENYPDGTKVAEHVAGDKAQIPDNVPVTPKGSEMRETANVFDRTIRDLEETQKNVEERLTGLGFDDRVRGPIRRDLEACKDEVKKLLPLRDNVEDIKEKILQPVQDRVREDSAIVAARIKEISKLSNAFGWVGVAAIFITILMPVCLWYFDRTPKRVESLANEIQGLTEALKHTIKNTSKISILLYDDFEDVNASFYGGARITDLGSVGVNPGYVRDGKGSRPSHSFQPTDSNALVYKQFEVDCEKGCRLAVETMLKFGSNFTIRNANNKYQQLFPLEVEYQKANSTDWNELKPVMDNFKVPQFAREGEWLSIKSPLVEIPPEVGVKKVRLSLRNLAWTKTDEPQRTPIVCTTNFDDVELFFSPSL